MSDQNNEAKEMKFELEVAPIESITRAEIDTQIATARQFPRSLAQFYKRAEAMITADQDTAESCFYQLRRKDSTQPGGFKLIEGESIRMAEIVAANFGNLRSAVHISGHTATRVSVRAVCHDLETNNLIAVEKQARTTYKDGTPYNEDMSIMTTNALVSKALRDAIFRVVPKALIKPLKEKAKLVAFGEGQAFIDRRKKAFAWATVTRKVPADRVLAVLGIKGEEDMTIEHLEILTGLKNAIMEGDQTTDEAFPPLESGNKPVFEHPAKKEQEAEKKPAPVAETKPKAKVETKATEPTPKKEEPKPAPVIAPVAAPVATPTTEPTPAKVETPKPEPAPQPEPVAEPAPEFANMGETQPDAPAGLSPDQEALKKVLSDAGFTFEDFNGWGRASSIPFMKAKLLMGYEDVPDEKAKFFVQHLVGVKAGITSYLNKK